MIKFYEDKEVGGIRGWNWIETDTGAWDGPKMDWEYHHLPNIHKFVKQFRTVIQAGGNQGMYPRLLSRLFTNVYTFEPDPLNFKTLVTNCDYDNVVKIQAALGNEPGYCNINRLTMANVGMHTVSIDKQALTPVLTIDSTIIRSDVDLVMLDLEGFEPHAISGMKNVLKHNKPVIFLERPSTDLTNYMKLLGYSPIENSAMDVIFVAH